MDEEPSPAPLDQEPKKEEEVVGLGLSKSRQQHKKKIRCMKIIQDWQKAKRLSKEPQKAPTPGLTFADVTGPPPTWVRGAGLSNPVPKALQIPELKLQTQYGEGTSSQVHPTLEAVKDEDSSSSLPCLKDTCSLPAWMRASTSAVEYGGAPKDKTPEFDEASKVPLSQPHSRKPETVDVTRPLMKPKLKSQLAKCSQQETSLKAMPLCVYKIPAKIPGSSFKTQTINLSTNYLRMSFKPTKKIFWYDIQFNPSRPKQILESAFNQAKEEHFPHHIVAIDSDARHCYCIDPLSVVPATSDFTTSVLVTTFGKPTNVQITIKAVGTADVAELERYMQKAKDDAFLPPFGVIQALDIILRHGFHSSCDSTVKCGRILYSPPSDPVDLGCGMEKWIGLFQSAIVTSAAYVNIDVVNRGFRKNKNLIEIIKSDFKLDLTKPFEHQWRNQHFREFKSYFRQLRVTARSTKADGSVLNRQFLCNQLMGTPRKVFFTYTNPSGQNKSISVHEYFTAVKKYRIKYPNFNCVWVGPKNKNIYYPIELLDVVYGQCIFQKYDDQSIQINQATMAPVQRKRNIEEAIEKINYQSSYYKKFGLRIETKLLNVAAKVLQPPHLDIGDKAPILPRYGYWKAPRLLKPESLRSWAFFAVEPAYPNQCDFGRTIQLIIETGTGIGMKIDQPQVVMLNVQLNRLLKTMNEKLKGIEFLFIVISAKGDGYYAKIKKIAEMESSMLTQCIREETVHKGPVKLNDILQCLMLKVNAKLSGVNQAIHKSCLPKCLVGGGVMIVGADVTHSAPEMTLPSIAAVSASMDSHYFKYKVEMSVQLSQHEIIDQFGEMMRDHFIMYKKINKALPNKIFVFRDGVGDNQFTQVLNNELAALHNAYRRLSGSDKLPEVLMVIVQKRHHTRFFDMESNENVQAGTVVDTDIVHPRQLDFYLVSHRATKGTVRPTRYQVVCNDGRIPADEVEQLTYYLCHLYSRCMRSVSYPTPTYYAHLACLRARFLTFGNDYSKLNLEKNPQRLHVAQKIQTESGMFFV